MKFNYKTVIVTSLFIALINPLMASASIKSTHLEKSAVTVTYSAAELNTADGIARIESRVRQAARKVCGTVGLREAGSVRNLAATKTCYNGAVEKAINSIESFEVTGL